MKPFHVVFEVILIKIANFNKKQSILIIMACSTDEVWKYVLNELMITIYYMLC